MSKNMQTRIIELWTKSMNNAQRKSAQEWMTNNSYYGLSGSPPQINREEQEKESLSLFKEEILKLNFNKKDNVDLLRIILHVGIEDESVLKFTRTIFDDIDFVHKLNTCIMCTEPTFPKVGIVNTLQDKYEACYTSNCSLLQKRELKIQKDKDDKIKGLHKNKLGETIMYPTQHKSDPEREKIKIEAKCDSDIKKKVTLKLNELDKRKQDFDDSVVKFKKKSVVSLFEAGSWQEGQELVVSMRRDKILTIEDSYKILEKALHRKVKLNSEVIRFLKKEGVIQNALSFAAIKENNLFLSMYDAVINQPKEVCKEFIDALPVESLNIKKLNL